MHTNSPTPGVAKQPAAHPAASEDVSLQRAGTGVDADSCRKGHQGVGQSMAWPPGCGAPCQVMTIRARFVRGECSLGQPRQGAAGRDKHQLLARR